MRTYTQNKDGSGNSAESDFINRQARRNEELQFYDTATVKWQRTPRGIRANVAPARAAGTGSFDWMYPDHTELDPRLFYSTGKFAYVSPQSDLATIGLLDLTTGTVLPVTPGTWLAMQNVAPKTVSGWRVPQDGIPSGGITAPSGSPLLGDLDNPIVYWVLWKSVC